MEIVLLTLPAIIDTVFEDRHGDCVFTIVELVEECGFVFASFVQALAAFVFLIIVVVSTLFALFDFGIH